RIHNARCPRHGDGSCICEWLIEKELALALCEQRSWIECEESARRAIDIHVVTVRIDDPTDRAILAIALAQLGRHSEAEEALSAAEADQKRLDDLDAAAQRLNPYHDSNDQITPRLLDRAAALIRVK